MVRAAKRDPSAKVRPSAPCRSRTAGAFLAISSPLNVSRLSSEPFYLDVRSAAREAQHSLYPYDVPSATGAVPFNGHRQPIRIRNIRLRATSGPSTEAAQGSSREQILEELRLVRRVIASDDDGL